MEENNGVQYYKNSDWAADMSEIKPSAPQNEVKAVQLGEIITLLPKSQREKIISGYDIKSFAKIFEDEAMMQTVDAFLKNGMNITHTADILYMHRNTLTYRLKAIKKQTGLDLRDFEMALTFKFLHLLYEYEMR